MNRPALFIAYIGGPGTGKTYNQVMVLRKLVRKGDRAIIIDPSRSNPVYENYPQTDDLTRIRKNFKGFVVSGYVKPNKEGTGTFQQLWRLIESGHLTDFNLVLDDTNLFARTRVEEDLENIITLGRNKAVDIWTTGHSLKSVPVFFLTYINTYRFFPVRNFAPERAKYLDDYEGLLKVMKRVTQNGQKYYDKLTKKYDHRHQSKFTEYCDQNGDPLT